MQPHIVYCFFRWKGLNISFGTLFDFWIKFLFFYLGHLSEPQHISYCSFSAWMNIPSRGYQSVICVCVCLYPRSVPTHAPHTVTFQTAVARVPSPTLVYSTAPPYRYMARYWILTPTPSVWLTWSLNAESVCFHSTGWEWTAVLRVLVPSRVIVANYIIF